MGWIKGNIITLIFISTSVIGIVYYCLPISEARIIHLNGDEGFKMYWHVWIVLNYIQTISIAYTRVLKKITDLDILIIKNYIAFDIYSFLVYMYAGFPLRNDLIVLGFCVACGLSLIQYKKWKI